MCHRIIGIMSPECPEEHDQVVKAVYGYTVQGQRHRKQWNKQHIVR
jgi:hypothetical protein